MEPGRLRGPQTMSFEGAAHELRVQRGPLQYGRSRRMIDAVRRRQFLLKRANSKNLTVNERDVAKSSGFSPATVSILLNNAPLARYIAPTTKKAH